jgi:hypothetical protein
MKQLFSCGKRIRSTDKDLVFHITIAALISVFLLIVLLFHGKTIIQMDWKNSSLSQISNINFPYLLISMGVAGMVCLAVAFVF